MCFALPLIDDFNPTSLSLYRPHSILPTPLEGSKNKSDGPWKWSSKCHVLIVADDPSRLGTTLAFNVFWIWGNSQAIPLSVSLIQTGQPTYRNRKPTAQPNPCARFGPTSTRGNMFALCKDLCSNCSTWCSITNWNNYSINKLKYMNNNDS